MAKTIDVDDQGLQLRLGARVQERREQLGLPVRTLAQLSGLHYTYIYQVENGSKNVTVGALARIATALNTSPSAMMYGLVDEPGEQAPGEPAD